MDSLTHIALGAVIGDALVSKQIGRRALLIGAAAQSVPDIDFLAGFWLDTDSNLLAHRGFTHSILFIAVMSVILAFLARRLYNDKKISFSLWLLLFLVETSCHLLLDTMNAYGVGLLEPFVHARYSFNVLFVADPFFSVAPGIVALVLVITHESYRHRRRWQSAGWIISASYLALAIVFKLSVVSDVAMEIASRGISQSRYFATPTPMNTLLWYVVMEQEEGYLIGYRSVFDKTATDFQFVKRNGELLSHIRDREDVQNLIQFSNNYYVVSQPDSNLVFSDLRFGQQFGWVDRMAPFVFNYDLKYPDNNKAVIQRGRLGGWTSRNIKLTLRRIGGR